MLYGCSVETACEAALGVNLGIILGGSGNLAFGLVWDSKYDANSHSTCSHLSHQGITQMSTALKLQATMSYYPAYNCTPAHNVPRVQ